MIKLSFWKANKHSTYREINLVWKHCSKISVKTIKLTPNLRK